MTLLEQLLALFGLCKMSHYHAKVAEIDELIVGLGRAQLDLMEAEAEISRHKDLRTELATSNRRNGQLKGQITNLKNKIAGVID